MVCHSAMEYDVKTCRTGCDLLSPIRVNFSGQVYLEWHCTLLAFSLAKGSGGGCEFTPLPCAEQRMPSCLCGAAFCIMAGL